MTDETKELLTAALLVAALYALAPMERDPFKAIKEWWRNL